VIGTNKPDALETVKHMLEDVAARNTLCPEKTSQDEIAVLVEARQPEFFSYADWMRLDALELANGEAIGRPRLKFTSADDMLAALGR
jgi:ferredoxin--NADP+ reductase